MDEWSLHGNLHSCSGGWWLQNRRIGSGARWDVELLLGVFFVDFCIEEGCIEIQFVQFTS